MTNPYQSPATESEPPPRVRHWNRCPHCGEAACGFFGKSRIGPFMGRPCQACGKQVGVSWRWTGYSVLYSLLPMAVLVLVAMTEPYA
ncbi:MAG: hypothetical protein AAGJ46_22030, partial [Planctomycetota bacterium]